MYVHIYMYIYIQLYTHTVVSHMSPTFIAESPSVSSVDPALRP